MKWQPTVQGWQSLVLSVMGIVVLAGAMAGAFLLNRTDAVSAELNLNVQPARVAAYQLQAAVRDQETAVRGYAIAANTQFLEPYNAGQEAERDAAQQIRDRVGHRPELIADLDAIEAASAAWRTSYADPLIARVTPGVPKVLDVSSAERGKAQFDELRVLFDDQNQHLSEARQHSVDELDAVQNWRDAVLIAMVVAFFVAAVLSALVVRNAVNRPLTALAASCRKITEGAFGERIVP